MSKTNPRHVARVRRKKHIKKSVRGTSARPRLSVFRSARHIYAQIIDDDMGKTLASASTMSAEFKDFDGATSNIKAASKVGALVAEKAKTAGIGKVVFDRNGYLFHGRVKALADGAREAGLDF